MKIRLSGEYDINTKNFTNSSFGVFNYSNEKYTLLIAGSIYTNGVKNDAEKIISLYKQNPISITEKLVGLYILLIEDKTNNSLSIFHDISSSPISLYYAASQNTVYISTSLKHLLLTSKVKRQLNTTVVPEFLRNGFIDGKSTLIKGINKLQLFHFLIISSGSVKQIPISYCSKKYSIEEACSKWKESLNNSIESILSETRQFGVTLSGGFDTNYIANYINKNIQHTIPAFCIGGANGSNEIPLVENIVKGYNHLSLKTSLTDESTLKCLPDIVWRLEGSMYEIGVFLQYELAKLVSLNKCENLICGECADEVMDERFTLSDTLPLLYSNSNVEAKESHYIQYAAFLFVLKKNGIMENSFGVESHLPYLNIEFMNVANAIKKINGQDKRFHKAICTREVPERLSAMISHNPGTTHGQSLFSSINAVIKFYQLIENSSLFKQFPLKTTKPVQSNDIRTKLKNSLKKILRYHYDDSKMKKYNLSLEESKIRSYLYYAYLMVFEELFITGKYDSNLKDDGIELNLEDIFESNSSTHWL